MPVFPSPGIRNPYVPGASANVLPVPPAPPAYTPAPGGYSPPSSSAPQAQTQSQEIDWESIYNQMAQYFEPFVAQPGFNEGWNPMNLTPNFFAPGTGPWVGVDGGNVSPPEGYGVPSGGVAPVASASTPVIPKRPTPPGTLPVPGTSPFLEFSDQTLGYAPSSVTEGYLPSWLSGLGFQGQGNLGQYGERTYQGPQSPFSFTQYDWNLVGDPNIRSWLKYFLAGGALPTGK